MIWHFSAQSLHLTQNKTQSAYPSLEWLIPPGPQWPLWPFLLPFSFGYLLHSHWPPLSSFRLPTIVSPQVFCMYYPLSAILFPRCVWLALSFRSLPIYVLIQGSFGQPCKNNIYPFSDPDLMFFIVLNLHSEYCTFLVYVYLFNIFV